MSVHQCLVNTVPHVQITLMASSVTVARDTQAYSVRQVPIPTASILMSNILYHARELYPAV